VFDISNERKKKENPLSVVLQEGACKKTWLYHTEKKQAIEEKRARPPSTKSLRGKGKTSGRSYINRKKERYLKGRLLHQSNKNGKTSQSEQGTGGFVDSPKKRGENTSRTHTRKRKKGFLFTPQRKIRLVLAYGPASRKKKESRLSRLGEGGRGTVFTRN